MANVVKRKLNAIPPTIWRWSLPPIGADRDGMGRSIFELATFIFGINNGS